MALYKNSAFVSTSTSAEFDKTYSPADKVPHSGIYRCKVCGREVTSNAGQPLPPQNHHAHPAGAGAIIWQMIVFTETEGRKK